MKDKLIKLESILQKYTQKDCVSGEQYRYLMDNLETLLYAIQQLSKVEELTKTLADLKLQMEDGHKHGYESETVFWTRCIWEIDQALKGETK